MQPQECSVMIPQSRPDLYPSDFDYIEQLLRTRYVAGGPLVEELETTFCKRISVRYAIAVANGTSALHLALLALQIGQGDEVILPSYACPALLHAVNYTGALPVLCDIDPDTFNPTARELQHLLTSRTRAIIVTHTFGFPADLSEIKNFGVPVIEDCAQALGASFHGRATGSIGEISVFSFYATKVICSGEGGMVCTNSKRLASRVRDLNQSDMRGDYKIRYNYKLSDLAAGLALRQVSRLEGLITRRKEIARRYTQEFAPCENFKLQLPLVNTDPNYYRFVVRTPRARTLISKTTSQGIICDRPIFRPLHAYLRLPVNQFRHTATIWKTGVSVPLYPALTNVEVEDIVRIMRESAS